MNGLIDDKKRSVVPTVHSKVCVALQILSDELQSAAGHLLSALLLRAQHMRWSRQRFPRVAARALRMLLDEHLLPPIVDQQLLAEMLDTTAQGCTNNKQI